MRSRIPEEALRRLAAQLDRWNLPQELAAELLDHHAFVTYVKDEPLFLRGSTTDVAFWILSGLVKIYYPNPDGSRVLVGLVGPGDVTGFADYLEPDGRRAQAFEAQPLTKASVALFTRDYVIKALQKLSPEKLVAVFEQLNTSWSSLACAYGKFLGMSFRERLQAVFAHLAARFSVRDARRILLTVELSHDDLAEMIAGSRAMVSRSIAEMMDQHIISRQGKYYILLNNSPTKRTEHFTVRAIPESPTRGFAKPRVSVLGSLGNGSGRLREPA